MLCGNKRSYILKSYIHDMVKAQKNTKSKVFLQEFFNKFEDIGK